MFDALLAYTHFLAFAALAACLALEWRLCRPGASQAELTTLGKVDLAYFAAALLALATGLARLFWGAKGVGFYAANPLFHAKLALYLAIGLISIAPTLRFIRWARQMKAVPQGRPEAGQIRATRRLIAAELGLLAALPFLAALMARGIGLG